MSRRRRIERLEEARRQALIASLTDEEIDRTIALGRRAQLQGIDALSDEEQEALCRVLILFDEEASAEEVEGMAGVG